MTMAILNYFLRILSVLSLTLASGAFAAEISLYDQPAAGAKIVGSVDMAAGITPIFTPKNKEE